MLCYLVLVFSSLLLPTDARITHAALEHDNRRSIALSRPFGFVSLGHPHLNFEISDLEVIGKGEKDLDCFAFYLVHTSFEVLDTGSTENKCISEIGLAQAGVVRITGFDEQPFVDWLEEEDPKKRPHSYSFQYTDTNVTMAGLHILFFVNCCNDRHSVSFNIKTEMYNVDSNGQKSYLSLGEIELPSMYMIMCLLYGIGLSLWSYVVVCNKQHAHKIHYLMIALGAFKTLTLLAQCGMYHYIRVTGTPDGWNIAYYIFTFFRGTFLAIVIILIGTGWSYMTPFLGDKERTILMIVLPLQVVNDIGIIVLDEFTPAERTWFAWRDIMQVADIVACCAILFPIAWRIRHLREAANTDGKAERCMHQLVLFQKFYMMVVVYIYFTRIIVRLLEATVVPQYVWTSSAAQELASLVFYTLTALLFRPQEEGSYSRLVSDTEIEMGSYE